MMCLTLLKRYLKLSSPAEAMAAQGITPKWLPADEALAAFEAEAVTMNKIAEQMG